MRVLALLLILAGGAAAAQEHAPPGASSCSGCHGARTTAIPSLAGQPAQGIADAMRAFRSGERPATVMNRLAKGFDDAEIAAIADYWARQPGSHP